MDGTTETRTHNDVNALTGRTIGEGDPISLSYDAAGNVTQDGDSNGDHKYTWDYRNRLIEVEEKQSGNWNTVGEYKYDAQNRRVLKVVTNKGSLNGTTRFLWGGVSDWQCLEERDSSGDLVARFTYSPGYIDAVAVQERDLNSDDDFADANEVVYYHSSTLSTVYVLSDSGGSVIERYEYDGYGAVTVLDADHSDDADGISDVENPYLFTGRRLDLESDLMQYRNRYYAPTLGRFISRDPVGYEGGYGLYAYVSSRPTKATDVLGKQWSVPSPFDPYDPYDPCDPRVRDCVLRWARQAARIAGDEADCIMNCRKIASGIKIGVTAAHVGSHVAAHKLLVAYIPTIGKLTLGVVSTTAGAAVGLAGVLFIRHWLHDCIEECKAEAKRERAENDFQRCMCVVVEAEAYRKSIMGDTIAIAKCGMKAHMGLTWTHWLLAQLDYEDWYYGGRHGPPPLTKYLSGP